MKWLERKIKSQLAETYDNAFIYMTDVISSCKTEKQLFHAYFWAKKLMGRYREKECSLRNFSVHIRAARRYFDLKSDILDELVDRKQEVVTKDW